MIILAVERTLEQVADIEGCTRERVRQIERKALRKLRKTVRLDVFREFNDLMVDHFWRGEEDGNGNRRKLPKPPSE